MGRSAVMLFMALGGPVDPYESFEPGPMLFGFRGKVMAAKTAQRFVLGFVRAFFNQPIDEPAQTFS